MSLTVIISTLLIIIVVGLPSVVICRAARRVAPALTHPDHQSGFGGLLYAFVVGQVGVLLTAVWQASYMTSELFFMLKRETEIMLTGAMAVVPIYIGIILGAVLLWQIAFKRTASTVASSIVLLWLIGPGIAALQSWYFKMALTEASVIQIVGWCIFWTGYFALSSRVALTYATPRGKKIAAGEAK